MHAGFSQKAKLPAAIGLPCDLRFQIRVLIWRSRATSVTPKLLFNSSAPLSHARA